MAMFVYFLLIYELVTHIVQYEIIYKYMYKKNAINVGQRFNNLHKIRHLSLSLSFQTNDKQILQISKTLMNIFYLLFCFQESLNVLFIYLCVILICFACNLMFNLH